MSEKLEPLWWRVLVGLDNLLNVLVSVLPVLKKKGFGYVDETISSVVGKQYYYKGDRSWYILAVFCFVEFFDKGHFKKYIEHDEGFKVENH